MQKNFQNVSFPEGRYKSGDLILSKAGVFIAMKCRTLCIFRLDYLADNKKRLTISDAFLYNEGLPVLCNNVFRKIKKTS